MRHFIRNLIVVGGLGVSLTAVDGVAGVAVAGEGPSRPRIGRIGITGDVGVPEGAMLGLAVRPFRPVRIGLAAGSNAIGFGARASLTLKVPVWLGPSLTVEGGWYPPADANGLVSRIAGSESAAGPARGTLESIGYHWGSARAGLEFGDRRGSFVIAVGMTQLHSTVERVDEWTTDPTDEVGPLRVTVLGPSAQVGGVVWLGRGRRARGSRAR